MSRYCIEYGQRVKLARRAAGLSQEELAKALGLSRSSVANIEAGRQTANAADVVDCAAVLAVPAGWLLVGDSNWVPAPAKLPRQQMLLVAERLRQSAEILEAAAAPPPAAKVPRRHPDAKINPPWDDDTVTALNAFQAAEGMHPFTCPRDHFTAGEAKLVATADGWVCSHAPVCAYTQDWAHASMATDRSEA